METGSIQAVSITHLLRLLAYTRKHIGDVICMVRYVTIRSRDVIGHVAIRLHRNDFVYVLN